ncbi:hypothetical protein EGH31_0172 [Haemophilus haemolyticus]|uniref:Uncharacterized protein n=1 Tax=Haemophilus haemolyticus TaxID=726 RepID=A0AAQ1YP14_HAEHA|nr:hypothetical protein EGH31_0172 [Haemophilus haemolyticus]
MKERWIFPPFFISFFYRTFHLNPIDICGIIGDILVSK